MRHPLPLLPLSSITFAALLATLPLAASAQTSAGGEPPPGGVPKSTAPAAAPKPLGAVDKKFVKDASGSIFYVLELLKPAKGSATGEATKKIYESGQKELTSAWEGVAKLSTARNEKLVTEVSSSDKQALEKLKKVPADKFDKAFLKDFSKELKKLSLIYDTATKSAQDSDIKSYAITWVPTLKTQTAEADKAEAEAGKRK